MSGEKEKIKEGSGQRKEEREERIEEEGREETRGEGEIGQRHSLILVTGRPWTLTTWLDFDCFLPNTDRCARRAVLLSGGGGRGGQGGREGGGVRWRKV